jgi:outer membrane protein
MANLRAIQRNALAATLFLFAQHALAAPAPVSFDRGLEAALKRSELVAAQAESVVQAEERQKQARGAIYPTVNLLAGYTRQEEPENALGKSIFPSAQPSLRINAAQPVFRGFREFAALRQTQLQAEASQSNLDLARTNLFVDYASNFLSIASFERELDNLDGELTLYDDWIRELRGRVRIGRSRPSEVLTIEAQRASVLAQKEQTRAQMLAAREQFQFLTGLPMDSPIQASPKAPYAGAPPPLDKFLESIENRPDLRVLRAQQEASDATVDIAWGEHLPTIDLQGNYWLERVGPNASVSWDIQASLVLPLFAGGTISSRVRESVSIRKQAELGLERSRRLAQQEVRSLYQIVRTDQEQIKALELATDASEKNHRQQKRDYALGLVTNLDVLQSVTASQTSRRALDRALFTAQLNRLRLEAAASISPQLQSQPETTAAP